MQNKLSGKTALVTGGTRGIGAAIVKKLVAEGAAVAFTYVHSANEAQKLVEEIKTNGGKILAIKADSASVEDIRQAVNLTHQTFGRLDILVNSAGIFLPGLIDSYTETDFNHMFAVNVRAAFFAAQAASNLMTEGGRIITIGSIMADKAGFPGTSVYALTKSALAGMVRGLALDLAPRNITVNNIQPGPTTTDANPPISPDYEINRKRIPLQRFGTVEDIANLVAYIADPDSSFITGTTLSVDGGLLA